MRRFIPTATTLICSLAFSLGAAAQGPSQARSEAWDAETVELFATLPVQDGGRVKPMDTLAGFKLLKLNGKRSLKTPDGERLGRSEWLLDCLFFPEQAKTYECFLVQDSQVLTAAGIRAKERRDRYSYQELVAGRSEFFHRASRAAALPAEERDRLQRQTLALASDMMEFEQLVGFMDFARGEPNRFVRGLAIFPPLDQGDENAEWIDPVSLTLGRPAAPEHAELLATLKRMEATKLDRPAFRAELATLNTGLRGLAEVRGQYGKIPLEVRFYQLDFFTRALVFFLLAFLLVALSWLVPRLSWVRYGVWGSLSVGAVLVVAGVTMRCIIRGRPPVSTLYETILFITGCCVLVSMAIEWMNRQRIALALSTVLGAGGMFLAMKYELREAASAGDTMPSLVAVLDTNFWLATHVTIITLGYAAGLLAAAIAHVWILGKLFGIRRGDKAFYKTVSRMVYGVVCFCLLFAVVGTILGGIWANYSWGRFWGWDPKENGALLICLWGIAMLHGRMGGYLRDHGMAAAAVALGGVVVFSWWGVNQLGVGLHSYGFTDGVVGRLLMFYGIESAVLLASGAWWLAQRGMPAPAKAPGEAQVVAE